MRGISVSSLREINAGERKLITKMKRRGRVNTDIAYSVSANAPVCVTYRSDRDMIWTYATVIVGDRIYCGATKRVATDPPNQEIGRTIAFCRAICQPPAVILTTSEREGEVEYVIKRSVHNESRGNA